MQLDLIEWARIQRNLVDYGGKCAYCLEDSNWYVTSEYRDTYETEYQLQCQTVIQYDEGDADWCLANKTVLRDHDD